MTVEGLNPWYLYIRERRDSEAPGMCAYVWPRYVNYRYTAGMKILRRVWHRLFGHPNFMIWMVNASGSMTKACPCGRKWLRDFPLTTMGTSSTADLTASTIVTDDLTGGIYDHQAIP